MTDQNQNVNEPQSGQPDAAPPAAFCQNCGRPLDKESTRVVGSAVYCEPCLAAQINGRGAGPAPGTGPFASGAWANTVWPAGGIAPTPPNPGLATLLGFIPGVGAMYNEQYAKGIVHLIVFAVLVTLVNANGIFLLFVFGWVFYMAFEAHHTAQARRDGSPLPNPFGLNDIGERFGFGRAWPNGSRYAPPAAAAPPAGAAGATAQGPGSPGWTDPATGKQTAAEVPGWGAPVDEYGQSRTDQPPAYGPVHAYPPPYASDYARNLEYDIRNAAVGYPPNPDSAHVPPPGASMPPYGYGPYTAPPYNSTYVPPIPGDPNYVAPPSRFPAGAVWLIGLGTLFLLTTTGIFNGFPGGVLVGFVLIGLGVWVFLRKMADSGGLGYTSAPGYPVRVVRAARGAVWLALLGLLLLLNDFHILRWHQSWPLFIITAGVMALLERSAWSNAAMDFAPPVPGAVGGAAGPASAPPAGTSMSVVPTVSAADTDRDDAEKGGR